MKEGDIAPDIDPGVAAFAFNAVFMNLGLYIMERLQISPDALLEKGRATLASPIAQAIMEDAIRVLEKRAYAAPWNGEMIPSNFCRLKYIGAQHDD